MKTRIYKCALCGHESENFFVFRTIFLNRQKELQNGYFKPHLTEDELYHLDIDESIICGNRKQCQERQYKNYK